MKALPLLTGVKEKAEPELVGRLKEELEKVEAVLAGGWANAELTAVVGVGLLITEASGLSTVLSRGFKLNPAAGLDTVDNRSFTGSLVGVMFSNNVFCTVLAAVALATAAALAACC